MECRTRQNGAACAKTNGAAAAAGFFSSGAISTLGNSHKCALTPPAGRRRANRRPFLLTIKARYRRCCTFTGALAIGNSSTRLLRRAKQVRRRGQAAQAGCLGWQISAPNSINASFNRPQFPRRGVARSAPRCVAGIADGKPFAVNTSSSASAHNRRLASFPRGSPLTPKSRLRTRITLPSKTGAGWL